MAARESVFSPYCGSLINACTDLEGVAQLLVRVELTANDSLRERYTCGLWHTFGGQSASSNAGTTKTARVLDGRARPSPPPSMHPIGPRETAWSKASLRKEVIKLNKDAF